MRIPYCLRVPSIRKVFHKHGLNMIPFFEEVGRVTAADGTVVVASFSGPATPIWVPHDVLRERFGRLGFGAFEEVAAGPGTALVARRG